MKNIALVGFMGSGKTSVGRKLAQSLNFKFTDTDELIEKEQGETIKEIFKNKGEKYFRHLEKEVIAKVAEGKEQVIACGGGAVLDSLNVSVLKKKGLIVYLMASFNVLYERTRVSSDRPLLEVADPRREAKRIYNMRQATYQKVADIVVETTELGQDQAVEAIREELERRFD